MPAIFRFHPFSPIHTASSVVNPNFCLSNLFSSYPTRGKCRLLIVDNFAIAVSRCRRARRFIRLTLPRDEINAVCLSACLSRFPFPPTVCRTMTSPFLRFGNSFDLAKLHASRRSFIDCRTSDRSQFNEKGIDKREREREVESGIEAKSRKPAAGGSQLRRIVRGAR